MLILSQSLRVFPISAQTAPFVLFVSSGLMRQNMNLPSFELGFWPIVDVLATLAVSYVTLLWLTKEHAPAVDFDVEVPDLSSVDSEPLERPSIQVNHHLLFSSIAHIGIGKG